MELSWGLTQPVLPEGEDVTVDLLLTFRADYTASRRADRRPLALSMVIDRSGSMSGAPLKHATDAAIICPNCCSIGVAPTIWPVFRS